MRKNLRKIPLVITEKIDQIKSELISVSVPIKIKKSTINETEYSNLQLIINEDGLALCAEYLPPVSVGRFSLRNINGYKGKPLKDLPKISKEFYAGERYPFGNTDADTFSLYVTKKVWQRNNYPPKEWSVISELIDTQEVDGDIVYTIKVGIDQLLNKNDKDFDEQLFFALNLLYENIGQFDVYDSDAQIDDYTKSTYVEWEIFPQGTKESVAQAMIRKIRNITPSIEQTINERAEFLNQMHPKEYIYGKCLNKQYFGAKFSDEIVVFENIKYGNAIYVLFENWAEVSKLSRLDIMKLPPRQYIRIPHRKNWKSELKTVINERLSNHR